MNYNEPLTHQLGHDGFVWWIGVVESMDSDVLAVGRAKVRIFNWHTADTEQLSTNDLPWAFPLMPVTHAINTPTYRPGDWVVGFFLDGHIGQQPMIAWVMPAIPQQ